jgi:hypothetical protein
MLLRWMLDGIELWRKDKVLDNPAMRGKHVFEDIDGKAGGSSTGFYTGMNAKTAYGAALITLTIPLGPGMRDAGELERDPKELEWLDCIPVAHLPLVAAAWAHKMREDGELAVPLMEWERHRTVAVAALRDFMSTTEGEAFQLSRRFGRAQRRYLLATWREPDKLAEMVERYLRYLLHRPPFEMLRIGKVPPSLPGLVPDLVKALAGRGLLGTGMEHDDE